MADDEEPFDARGLVLFFEPELSLARLPAWWIEVREIRATGEYRMGDNDTRADAKKLALLKEEGVEFDDRRFLITKVNEKEDGGWALDVGFGKACGGVA